jgi:hypothetical protein
MAFWSATVSADAPKSESVPVNAVLIITNLALADEQSQSAILRIDVDGGESLAVAHLDRQHTAQHATTLHFLPGSVVNFKVEGRGKVNLIGFYESLELESEESISGEGAKYSFFIKDLFSSQCETRKIC